MVGIRSGVLVSPLEELANALYEVLSPALIDSLMVPDHEPVVMDDAGTGDLPMDPVGPFVDDRVFQDVASDDRSSRDRSRSQIRDQFVPRERRVRPDQDGVPEPDMPVPGRLLRNCSGKLRLWPAVWA